jgi:hypothetical protein
MDQRTNGPTDQVLDPGGFNIYLRTFFVTFQDKEKFYSEKLFRKLRLNGYINKQKSESKFLNEFSEQFGSSESTDVFIGDWDSSRHTLKGQMTTKGIRFRKMFRKYGYKVYLVDEYKTSKTCPVCFQELECDFKMRKNPKFWKRNTTPLVPVHGLLRCQSEICQQECNSVRLWNRDDVATMNIRTIVNHTISTGERPDAFKRNFK